MESPCECSGETPGFINHVVSHLVTFNLQINIPIFITLQFTNHLRLRLWWQVNITKFNKIKLKSCYREAKVDLCGPGLTCSPRVSKLVDLNPAEAMDFS